MATEEQGRLLGAIPNAALPFVDPGSYIYGLAKEIQLDKTNTDYHDSSSVELTKPYSPDNKSVATTIASESSLSTTTDDQNNNNYAPSSQPMDSYHNQSQDLSSIVAPFIEAVTDVEASLKAVVQAEENVPTWSNPSLAMGRALVLIASIIYGTNFATVKMLDDVMPLAVSAALRFSLAAAVVAACVLGTEAAPTSLFEVKERNMSLLWGMEVGLWYFFAYTCQAIALQTIEAGKSGFYNALAVIVAPIMDAIFRGKTMGTITMSSIGLACCGVAMLNLGGAGTSAIQFTSGDIIALGQTVAFGIGYWRLEQLSQKFPAQTARLTVGQLIAIAIGSILYTVITSEESGEVVVTVEAAESWFKNPFILSALMWTGLISTALALYLETVSLKVVSASELTLLMTTTSLWGAGFAYITIGEVLSFYGMIGGMLILGGCVLGNVKPHGGETHNLKEK